jgi:NAD(P)-dependent dehydrogenase (short-subunit alcohol dehydrogenase family)
MPVPCQAAVTRCRKVRISSETSSLAVSSGKREYFAHVSDTNPAGRIGTVDDVAEAVLFALTNTFMTGVTLKVDGGEPLV